MDSRGEFVDPEVIILADSEIRIARSLNNFWTYTLSYSFGTPGSASRITVYNRPDKDRESALNGALDELKKIMQLKLVVQIEITIIPLLCSYNYSNNIIPM